MLERETIAFGVPLAFRKTASWPIAVLFSMFCGSGIGVSGDKIRRDFDGGRTAVPMRT
jgi:hypothetical protein